MEEIIYRRRLGFSNFGEEVRKGIPKSSNNFNSKTLTIFGPSVFSGRNDFKLEEERDIDAWD